MREPGPLKWQCQLESPCPWPCRIGTLTPEAELTIALDCGHADSLYVFVCRLPKEQWQYLVLHHSADQHYVSRWDGVTTRWQHHHWTCYQKTRSSWRKQVLVTHYLARQSRQPIMISLLFSECGISLSVCHGQRVSWLMLSWLLCFSGQVCSWRSTATGPEDGHWGRDECTTVEISVW